MMKIKTWKDLKEFLSTLDETQLSEKAVLSIIDSHNVYISQGLVNEEEEYLTEEGYVIKSALDQIEIDDLGDCNIRPIGFVYLLNDYNP
jgi:hypothetical protein